MKRAAATKQRPHKLALYRRAVQHEWAEASFLIRTYTHYRKTEPLLLREDFAGTCAVASAWVSMSPDHQAMAIEAHGPTVKWAQRTANKELADAAGDLHIVQADVLNIDSPKVDVTCALNFSTFIYHDRDALLAYFKAARRGLRRNGLMVLDAYGGPGAMRIGTQTRKLLPDKDDATSGGTYHWEQRTFDPVTHRTECRIHFNPPDGRRLDSAFIYHWRLWTLPELTELMLEAGFKTADVWCDMPDRDAGQSDGRYRRLKHMPAREDWVAYVVGVR